jgi:hypothetical protein
MSYHYAFDSLHNRLEEQRETVVGSITRGNMNFEEYKRLCGVLQGLDFAKQMIIDLAKKLEIEDGED